MAILVCGGAGYIGSHISKLLTKKGYEVIVLDDLSSGRKEFARYGKFIQGNIGDAALLDEILSKNKIEAAFHFCAFIEVGESVKDPAKYYRNNVVHSLTLLDRLMLHGVQHFIFSSTAAVYGEPEKVPILEEDAKAPINPYGRTKLILENILADYGLAYGLKSVCFRYFNAAGADEEGFIGEAHQPESHLIPLILDAAAGIRPEIKIFGTDYPTPDGTAIRDYIHVNDLARAHVAGMEYLLAGGKSDVFNLGTGNGNSVREVMETVKSVTGRDFKIVEVERRAGDPPRLVAANEKAKRILKWAPEHSLEEIVFSAWAWHQKKASVLAPR